MGSIPQEFGKGRYTIVDTFRRLVDGETTPDDIRPVTVFRHQNKFWAYSGNQRLYVFRKLEEFGMIESIPVNILNRSPFESGDVDVSVAPGGIVVNYCVNKFVEEFIVRR
jgi:hypothetical protein